MVALVDTLYGRVVVADKRSGKQVGIPLGPDLYDATRMIEKAFNDEDVDFDNYEIIDVQNDPYTVHKIIFDNRTDAPNVKSFVRMLEKLEQYDRYIDIVEESDRFDLSDFTEFEYYKFFADPEEFFNTYFKSAYDAARATYFGKINWNDDYAFINAYGNVETTSELEYVDPWETEHIEDIILSVI